MMILEERLAQLPTLTIQQGSHSSFEDGACAMEMASWLVGDVWTDHPACVCPVLGAFMRAWNDSLPDDESRGRLLLPLIPKLVGTKGSSELEQRRATMSADWLVRVYTPAWLRLAKLDKQAALLEALPEITDFSQCPSLMPTLTAVRSDAAAAWYAAWSAARSAAWSAARSAAWSAARSAACSSARSAAWTAACSAARSAAWTAARSAALDAAWTAARDAALSAAGDALSKTTATLQASAQDLVERMICCGEKKE